MVGTIARYRCGPIGVDLGSRSVKLMQLDSSRRRVREAVRWELPHDDGQGDAQRHEQQLVEALVRARQRRRFRGRRAVFCLGAGSLFVQNIRVRQASGHELRQIVHHEAAGRLPFSSEEAEIRFVEADDVRQADTVRREVILLACHRPQIDRLVWLAEEAGLVPVAIDVEPIALVRCYCRQYRRDEDQQRRVMFLNVGASNTTVVIARGAHALFVKYIGIGGRHFDRATAEHLKMRLADAVALRRHHGDRRADQRDPEITRSIAEAERPILEQLANELSLCLRYHSVTFRGQPLAEVVLSGGEASPGLAGELAERLRLPCEVGNPWRAYEPHPPPGRASQWDVAAGLALYEPE